MGSLEKLMLVCFANLCLLAPVSCGGDGECGGKDEACCNQAPQCDLGLACNPQELCVCGAEGEPCCPLEPRCDTELTCGTNMMCNVMDPCEQAWQIFSDGFDAACTSRPGCCFCDCWNAGHQMVDDPVLCTCESPGPRDPCTGDALTSAQDCLADRSACAALATDLVDLSCQ